MQGNLNYVINSKFAFEIIKTKKNKKNLQPTLSLNTAHKI